MKIFLFILGLFGIPSIITFFINILFKRNKEFIQILKSFPLVSKDEINNIGINSDKYYSEKNIPKWFTDFLNDKKSSIDEFLAKLENFNCSKLKFNKKEITNFCENTIRLLKTRSYDLEISGYLDLEGNLTNLTINTNEFKWIAFNYLAVYNIINDKKKINKLYICRFLNF